MKKNSRIVELWAYTIVGPDDCEGVIGMFHAERPELPMPLIGADRNRMDSLRSHAEFVAEKLGAKCGYCASRRWKLWKP